MAVAKSTVRVPLLKLVDFDKSEAGLKIKEQEEGRTMGKPRALSAKSNTKQSKTCILLVDE